jgi:N-glycosylase/DNA lyase
MIGYKVLNKEYNGKRLYSFWRDLPTPVDYKVGEWTRQPSDDKPLFVYKSLANQEEWWYEYEIYECEYIPSDVKEVRDIHPEYGDRRTPEDYGAGTAFATKVKLLRKVSSDELRRGR